MMKNKKLMRCCALLLSLLLVLCVAGCKSEPEAVEESAYEPEVSAAEESAPEPTEEPTPTPEPTPEPEPENVSVLTGLPTLTEEAIGKRPVAVMVNNVKAALPQYGISAADVIFEIPVEGDVTRLMALYSDYTQIPDVCSIRSCRYYYPILALGFDAIYVHWGTDMTIANEILNTLDIDHFEGMNGGVLFGRDQDRRSSGYALEHTGMFKGGNLPDLLESTGTRTELKEEYQESVFNFAAYGETVVPQGDDAASLRVDFGAAYSTFSYDAETHTYLKTHNDSKHIDGKTGEQLAFENVLVLETDISVRDDHGRKNVNWKGGSDYTGIYLSEGKVQPVTWSKADEYSPIVILDADGNELEMNRGKTYIAITYFDNYTIG